jgi:hypothetical protein
MGGVAGPIRVEDQPLRIDVADLLKEVVGEQGDLLVPIEQLIIRHIAAGSSLSAGRKYPA